MVVEDGWKAGPKGVKVPYTKLTEGCGYPEYGGARGILPEEARTIS